MFDLYSDDEEEHEELGDDSQVKDYFKNLLRMKDPEYERSNPNEALCWWSVNHSRFPIVAMMACDYLACSGSSAAPERTFSAAANVCSASQGGLAPITIERSVLTRMWLVEMVSLGDEFSNVVDRVRVNDFL